jgi:hypothetical protein
VPEELHHGLDSRILDYYTTIVHHILYASLSLRTVTIVTEPTTSKPSPTRSTFASSHASPPRTGSAPRCFPHAGPTSGAPPRSCSPRQPPLSPSWPAPPLHALQLPLSPTTHSPRSSNEVNHVACSTAPPSYQRRSCPSRRRTTRVGAAHVGPRL